MIWPVRQRVKIMILGVESEWYTTPVEACTAWWKEGGGEKMTVVVGECKGK